MNTILLPEHQPIDTSIMDNYKINPIFDYILYSMAVSFFFIELHIIYKCLT